ncbi:MAG TPA: FtsK/SpoIIIE domain-containing protein, partial [Acidimicrobiales bacterium]|nr:FtsK/SpoIIIE domain-containing protein [Acidimicrobiales bacterium]
MELLLSVGFPTAMGWQRVDLRAELDASATRFDALVGALAEWGRWHGISVPPRPVLLVADNDGSWRWAPLDRSVFGSGLVSGQEVRIADEADLGQLTVGTYPSLAEDPAALSLDIVSGPSAGCWVLLKPGRHVVGRSGSASVVVTDPAMAPEQFVVEVTPALEATIASVAGATSPTYVGSSAIDGTPLPLPAHETVLVGNSQFVMRPLRPPSAGRRDRLGQISFNPLPYKRPLVHPRRLEPVPAPPGTPVKGRFPAASILLPLIAAVVLVYVTKQVAFVALAALSPLMMLSNHFSEGRHSKSSYKAQAAEFRRRVESRAAEVDQALSEERRERLAAAPDLAWLVHQAAARQGRLWERARGAPDFLALRAGLGTVPSLVEVSVEPGGDPDLQGWAGTRLAHHASLNLAPVVLALDELPVAGTRGPAAEVDKLCASLLLQSALLHSPEHLVVAGAFPSDDYDNWSWLKWLPHTRSATSPLEGPHLVDETGVSDLVRRVAKVANERLAAATHAHTADADASWLWPRVLLVLHECSEPDRSALGALLGTGSGAGITVLWVGHDETGLPRQCDVVMQVQDPLVAPSSMRFTAPDRQDQPFVYEGVTAPGADRIARMLAPLRDVSAATATSGIPTLVELLDLPGMSPSPQAVAQHWASSAHAYGLFAPLGMGANGSFSVDLVHDGPHALIAGTSGAGKSELLQTLVLSLAAHHPPSRLALLFIDYKGGAASAPFEPLPHTVGQVTNLDERRALRALASLRAELRRRMALLEGRAKDLEEMLRVAPEDAPPSLVIVVDEFATLVKEIPEFVAGMVDIAQRGRSLGIHLVLATQRPGGSVSDNILANTNLRICLRVLDPSDSSAVIGSREASAIPVPLKGRAYARLGPGALMPFQGAWSGAPYDEAGDRHAVSVRPFLFTEPERSSLERAGTVQEVREWPGPVGAQGGATPTAPAASVTQLDATVGAIVGAAQLMGAQPPRRPWVEPLPEQLAAADLPGANVGAKYTSDPGRWAVIGLADLPDEQRQVLAEVDLETAGGMLVFGGGGAGKTTLLRTVAAGLAQQGNPGQVQLYLLDFAGRTLLQLEELPHVVAAAG